MKINNNTQPIELILDLAEIGVSTTFHMELEEPCVTVFMEGCSGRCFLNINRWSPSESIRIALRYLQEQLDALGVVSKSHAAIATKLKAFLS